MAKATNEIGKKYGKLVVIEEAGIDSSKHKLWRCQCDCGNIIEARGSKLRNGEKTHCGCEKRYNFVDETGNQYGRLTVIKSVGAKGKDRGIHWLCQCECGKMTEVAGRDLRQGKIQSCGCLGNETRGQSIVVDETGNRYGKLVVLEREDSHNGKARWICRCDCGNKTVANGCDLRSGRVVSCGCLSSLGEQQILQLLQSKNIPYKKEYCFTDLVSEKGGHPRFDFALFNENGLACLIEYQGLQHFIDKGNFGSVQRESTDKLKREYCLTNNIALYEIRYDDPLETTLKHILEKEKFYEVVKSRLYQTNNG